MPKKQDAAWWSLLFISTLAAYWPAIDGKLIWDDANHVTAPALESLHGLWRIWFDLGATQQYYPILHSAFWIEHRLWDNDPFGYHFINIFLHAVSAGLLVLIMRRLALPGAWLAGFVFALHPVCVESVAWISEQKSTLSGVFYLASALTYLHFDRSRRVSTYVWASLLFVLALLSKSVTATLPAALLLLLWYLRGHLSLRKDIAWLAPWLAIGVTGGLFTAWVERTYIGAQGAEFALTFPQHLVLAGRVIWFYAAKLVCPWGLLFSYPRWTIDVAGAQLLFPAGVLLVVAALVYLARRHRGPLAGFLFFGGTLFPVLGFLNVFPFRYSYVADHFQYLACLGLIVPLCARFPLRRAGVVVVLALAILTRLHAAVFVDDETLYRATLAGNPASWLAHMNLGSLLLQSGRLPEAQHELEESLRLKPDSAVAHDDLASVLAKLPGRLDDAIAEYETAVRLKPDYGVAYSNMGNALLQAGRVPAAIAAFQTAIRLDPASEPAHNNLGNAYFQTPGRLPDAAGEYEIALRLAPGNLETRYNLANTLLALGRLPDAIAQYQTILQQRPDFAEAHLNLANALASMPGRSADALAECDLALQINPSLEPARRLREKLAPR